MTRIMIVEDDPQDMAMLCRSLTPHFEVKSVRTLAEAIVAFAEGHYCAILLDPGLPDSQADKTVAAMKRAYPNCAIVVISGSEDPERIKRCISDSASSYIIKSSNYTETRLVDAINAAMASNGTCRKAEKISQTLNGFDI